MRLLNTRTIKLHEFNGNLPEYAILSHTWGEMEVSYHDIANRKSWKLGAPPEYSKIKQSCALAASDSWDYIWIDTCCIDKTSSAEFSEAINSMYRWYEGAQVCYIHLADIFLTTVDAEMPKQFRDSRWFKRGWTLQELLAPHSVVFYDRDWIVLGTRESLINQVSSATGISQKHIDDHMEASIAAKMSWASERKTTRIEDVAYSVLGLFDINMPLLYGEGEKAFIRLQHEIIKSSNDESIFAWKYHKLRSSGMFAQSPASFAASGDVRPITHPLIPRRSYTVTNAGLAIELSHVRLRSVQDEIFFQDRQGTWEAPLACATSDKNLPIVLQLKSSSRYECTVRSNPSRLESLSEPFNLALTNTPPHSRVFYVMPVFYISFSKIFSNFNEKHFRSNSQSGNGRSTALLYVRLAAEVLCEFSAMHDGSPDQRNIACSKTSRFGFTDSLRNNEFVALKSRNGPDFVFTWIGLKVKGGIDPRLTVNVYATREGHRLRCSSDFGNDKQFEVIKNISCSAFPLQNGKFLRVWKKLGRVSGEKIWILDINIDRADQSRILEIKPT